MASKNSREESPEASRKRSKSQEPPQLEPEKERETAQVEADCHVPKRMCSECTVCYTTLQKESFLLDVSVTDIPDTKPIFFCAQAIGTDTTILDTNEPAMILQLSRAIKSFIKDLKDCHTTFWIKMSVIGDKFVAPISVMVDVHDDIETTEETMSTFLTNLPKLDGVQWMIEPRPVIDHKSLARLKWFEERTVTEKGQFSIGCFGDCLGKTQFCLHQIRNSSTGRVVVSEGVYEILTDKNSPVCVPTDFTG
ncbi:hypothetical protein BDW69DRAFT_184426 [Aspergillus filifer]